MEDWNATSLRPYRIDLSIGNFIFDPSRRDEELSDEKLFAEALRMANMAMYEDKAAKRSDNSSPHDGDTVHSDSAENKKNRDPMPQ